MGTKAFALVGLVAAAVLATGMALDDGQVPGLIKGIVNGAIAGAVASILGWLKNRDMKTGEQERFDVKYLAMTVGVGVVVGAIAGWQNKDLSTFTAWLATTPYVIAAEVVIKAIFRQGVPPLRDLIDNIRGGGGASKPPGAS
jgi:hypothetical protein